MSQLEVPTIWLWRKARVIRTELLRQHGLSDGRAGTRGRLQLPGNVQSDSRQPRARCILRVAPMQPATTHRTIQPRVMYFGTPVVLVTTLNEDGSTNVAPMSSAWWVGSSCLLGLDETSQTTLNLQRTRELVLNLPSSAMADAVDRMAGYTGTSVVPGHKAAKGYRFIDDKFGVAGLHRTPSCEVQPARVAECPIQLEARVEDVRPFGGAGSGVVAVEAHVVRTHVLPELLLAESDRYIDPDRWDPLIMKFTHLYGGGHRVQGSRLAEAWAVPRNGSGPGDTLAGAGARQARKAWSELRCSTPPN
jgi:flavin reductase (DIM6/NTAB) family NADH-FMN oxidoreductase RutF